MKSQEELFAESEGDAWFDRNHSPMSVEDRTDWPTRLVSMVDDASRIRRVLDVGCCDGGRLAGLQKVVGAGAYLAGCDASAGAVRAGGMAHPGLDLRQGLLSAIPFEEPFDLVIVNFVLHWVDRVRLATAIAEIDRMVIDGGMLILGDFLPDFQQRRRYHHLEKVDVYTYKQDYALVFEALGAYRTVARVTYDHHSDIRAVGAIESEKRVVCSLLSKSIEAAYPIVE